MKLLSSYLVLTKQHKKVIDAVGECFCTACAPVTLDIRGRETHHLAFTSSKRFLLPKPASWQRASLIRGLCRYDDPLILLRDTGIEWKDLFGPDTVPQH